MNQKLGPDELWVPEMPTIHQVTKRWGRTLRAIDARFENGYAYIGERIQPGSSVPIDELLPTDEFPQIPIVLEFLQAMTAEGKDKVIARLIYHDLKPDSEWVELARADGYRWAKTLLNVASKYLPKGKNEAATPTPLKASSKSKSPDSIWSNIKAHIDEETKKSSPHDKLAILDYVSREIQRDINVWRALHPNVEREEEPIPEDEEF